jgi:hypothetical protein
MATKGTTFTPGPWETAAKPERWGLDYCVPIYADHAPSGDRMPAVAHGSQTKEGKALMRANARLIAAAPTLYDALAAALPWLEQRGNDEVVAMARAALARARGEVTP